MTILRSKSNISSTLLLTAKLWANERSKDPNTKVGAVIYDPTTGSSFYGYNGFPRGVQDTSIRWERPRKYAYVRHAEENAIIKALLAIGSGVRNCDLYCTHQPCHRCIGLIAQVGIKSVVFVEKYNEGDALEIVKEDIIKEAGITCLKLEPDDVPR